MSTARLLEMASRTYESHDTADRETWRARTESISRSSIKVIALLGSWVTAFALVTFGAASPAFAAAMFMGLGDLPGGEFSSAARAGSADGTVVVGFGDDGDAKDGEKAFRWENEVMTPLDGPPCQVPSGCDSRADDVSANGSVIVGRDGPHRAPGGRPGSAGRFSFRWQNDVMTLLCVGDFSFFFGISDGSSFGVSTDGSVVVGSCGEAFRWTEADGAVRLGLLRGSGDPRSMCPLPGSSAKGVSADGSVVVGRSDSVGEPDWSPPPEC